MLNNKLSKEFIDHARKLVEQEYAGNLQEFFNALKQGLTQVPSGILEDFQARPSQFDASRPIAVSLSSVFRTYKNDNRQIHAVKNLSLEIRAGEIVAIMGPSGSGKSTLLNLIGGLESPDQGEINAFGSKISDFDDKELSHYRNKTVGFVFQFFYLQPYLSVLQNIEIPLLFSAKTTQERNTAARDAISSVQLQDRITHLPSQLSGGQMQRVAIARALVSKPQLILADEPTGNLDRATGHDILQLLKKINQEFNTTMVIVTHDAEVASMADRVLTLRDGEIK